jgi:hypothetical protein
MESLFGKSWLDRNGDPMSESDFQRLHGLTGLITCAALVFWIFFQINKGGPFREINPFGMDPYDAIGSIAFQGALLVGILTYARMLRSLGDPSQQASKSRLILRGNGFVLAAIGIALAADAIAVILHPVQPSGWGGVLLAELSAMILLAAICALRLIIFWRGKKTAPPPGNLTPADAFDDLWTFVRAPAQKAGNLLPKRFADWVDRFQIDMLFTRAHWVHPRLHPWWFAAALGLLAGIALVVAQLQEGFPPSLAIGLLLAGIFISGEFLATLVGFAVFGGFLGLRPPLKNF